MRSYTIQKISGAPDWNVLPALDIDTRLWSPETGIQAHAQICWDESALHVHLWAKEAHVRAEQTGLLDMPCEDSCLEFFFAPVPGDKRYFNIEYNPNASLFLGLGYDRNAYTRLILTDAFSFDPKPARTVDGWEIAYSIPFAFIRLFFPAFDPKPGDEMRANCFKCGDLTPQEHYLSWNPVTSENPDFHRPCDFGTMVFEG